MPLPLWTSIATGVHPDRHGLLSGPSLDQRRQPAIWDRLAAHGLRSHVIGWPGTMPAEEIPGVFVTADFSAASRPETVSPARLRVALAGEPWEFAAVHSDALAYCSLHFAEYLPPRMWAGLA